MRCILCQHTCTPFYEYSSRGLTFHQCDFCCSILLDPSDYLSSSKEEAHYLTHNNDVEDIGYQEFVSPITDIVLQRHTVDERGLDYGSGTGPVIAKMLRDQNFHVTTFDPFFDNRTDVLNQKYDYIICSEVMEHFHRPTEEFEKLSKLLKPKGSIYCMTQLYSSDVDFKSWRYKNDPTHVIFYHEKAITFIEKKFSFSTSTVSKRLICFHNI